VDNDNMSRALLLYYGMFFIGIGLSCLEDRPFWMLGWAWTVIVCAAYIGFLNCWFLVSQKEIGKNVQEDVAILSVRVPLGDLARRVRAAGMIC